jgi:hypothetical protein
LIPNSCFGLVRRAFCPQPAKTLLAPAPRRCQHCDGDRVVTRWEREGHHIFADALSQFAEQSRNPRLAPIIRRISSPLRVTVLGRDGVGRGAVVAALASAGVTVTPDDSVADLRVVVIAETLKPEDQAMMGVDRPTVAVLNKADLTGFGAGGPLTLAHLHAATYRALTGVPTVPMVALLATADLDGEMISALRTLVSTPADLTSTDAFVQSRHPLSQDVRRRLLDTLDRFGIAHAVVAIGEGVDPAALPALLRGLSQTDRVVAHLEAAGAPVRYRRLRAAITELQTLAVQSGNERLTEFLSTDETVLAVMAAAVDVVEASGVRVDTGDDAASHLRRAVHWRRYSRGPVGALHRSCGVDISRGSLRLLGRVR